MAPNETMVECDKGSEEVVNLLEPPDVSAPGGVLDRWGDIMPSVKCVSPFIGMRILVVLDDVEFEEGAIWEIRPEGPVYGDRFGEQKQARWHEVFAKVDPTGRNT